MAAPDRGVWSGGGRSSLTKATIKMVKSAATDERTGDVRDIRMRNEPENAVDQLVSVCTI